MNKDRAITYSLLSHIRNKGTLIKGPLDIFKPLVKRTISSLSNKGVYRGKSTMEIKKEFDINYNIDIPIPVLNNILKQIAKEINKEDKKVFIVHNDNSFSIDQYIFLDYEETIIEKEKAINDIEKLFNKFCESSDFNVEDSSSIFKFIEKNKYSLSKYLSNNQKVEEKDYTAEAQFVNFFRKIPTVYNQIKEIYIGAIISGFIEYNPSETNLQVELLFDTNFIVGLLDLNTPESAHTCKTLLEIAKQQNYKIRVLTGTIKETKNLISQKAKHFDSSFLQRKVYVEDIYNACDRKGLTRSDLERIGDNLKKRISEFNIAIINDINLKKEAKFTQEYKILKEYRNSDISALHDATAINYVKKSRGSKIKEFDKVNCWFVNNVNSGESIRLEQGGYQPEIINADALLNILWLSNPQRKMNINPNDLADIGLTSSIAITLNKDLPKSRILRELDDNIHKYASESLSDSDIVRISTRITNKQLKEIDELNDLAKTKKEEFVKRLEEEANKQKRIEEHRIKRLESAVKEFSKKSEELVESKKTILKNEQNVKLKINSLENNNSELKERIINTEMSNWKKRSVYYLICAYSLIGLVFLGVFIYNSSSLDKTITNINEFSTNPILKLLFWTYAIIVNVFGFKLVYDRYFNNSNIINKRKLLEKKITTNLL